MNSLNRGRRRSQTFRVELLESRELLSTAELVSRPTTAVAPMARIAPVSGIPEVELTYTSTEQLTGTASAVYESKTRQYMQVSARSPGFPGYPSVSGLVYFTDKNNEIKLTKGTLTFNTTLGDSVELSFSKLDQLSGGVFNVHGDVKKGTGIYAKPKSGSFNGSGTLDTGYTVRQNTYNFSFGVDFKVKVS